MSSTRARILEAASELVDARPDSVPSMSAIARASDISRQALYGHFPDRPSLLLALVEHVDANEGLESAIAEVMSAPSGDAQARAWVEMQARRNPRIASLARALDQSRHDDSAAGAAWRDRMANRMRGATTIAGRLREEGRVDPSWTTGEAAALILELVSFRVWDDLVNEAHMPPHRYVEVITSTTLAALAAPISGAR